MIGLRSCSEEGFIDLFVVCYGRNTVLIKGFLSLEFSFIRLVVLVYDYHLLIADNIRGIYHLIISQAPCHLSLGGAVKSNYNYN